MWDIVSIGNDYNYAISITTDSLNRSHIVRFQSVYRLPQYKDFKYTYYTGAYWETYIVESNTNIDSSSICTDTSNNPHILYYLEGTGFRYAYWDPNVDIDGDEPTAPTAFSLSSAYPNPSSGSATICFALPRSSEISLELYDIKGRKVVVLAEGTFPAGEHEREVPDLSSGVYLYRLAADDFAQTKKLIVK